MRGIPNVMLNTNGKRVATALGVGKRSIDGRMGAPAEETDGRLLRASQSIAQAQCAFPGFSIRSAATFAEKMPPTASDCPLIGNVTSGWTSAV